MLPARPDPLFRQNTEAFGSRGFSKPRVEAYKIIPRSAPLRPCDGGGKLERVGGPQRVAQQNLSRDSANLFQGSNFMP